MPLRLTSQFRLFVALLALAFGVVTVAHAGTHLSESRAEANCTLCQHSSAPAVALVALASSLSPVGVVLAPISAVLSVPTLRAHASRGPPAG